MPTSSEAFGFFETGFLTSEVFDTNAPNYLVLALAQASKEGKSLGSYSVLYGRATYPRLQPCWLSSFQSCMMVRLLEHPSGSFETDPVD